MRVPEVLHACFRRLRRVSATVRGAISGLSVAFQDVSEAFQGVCITGASRAFSGILEDLLSVMWGLRGYQQDFGVISGGFRGFSEDFGGVTDAYLGV